MVKRSETSMLMAVTFAMGFFWSAAMVEDGFNPKYLYVVGIGAFVVWAILTAIIVGAYLTGQDSKEKK